MIQTINEWDFIDAFRAMRPDHFSEAGLSALHGWYAELEDSTGEPIELDVIAICCDWTEYDAAELLDEYGEDEDEDEDEDERIQAIVDRLNHESTCIQVADDCFLVMAH